MLVLEEEKRIDGRYYCLCKCDCGNEKYIRSTSLKNKATKTCGKCSYHKIQKRQHSQYNQYDLSGAYGIGYTSKREEFYFDLEDYEKIKNYTWYVKSSGYIKAENLDYLQHRIITNVVGREKFVDHINHNKLDNRKSNLRIVNNSQNQMNRNIGSNNSSGHRGISWHKNKHGWIAQIGVNKRLIYLGFFKNIEDAIRVRNEAEDKYFGEYNFKIF